MKKFLINFLLYSQYFMLFLSIIFTNIFYHSFNNKFYSTFYFKNSLANKLNISSSNLEKYTTNLLTYLKYDTSLDNIWYTKKDILHMVDVKNLYLLFYKLNLAMIIAVIIFNLLLFIILKKKYIILLTINFNKIFIIFCLLLSGILIVINFNFNYFWIKFHEIFFSNDLWLLSPTESNLIKMFPEAFFYTLVLKIIISIFGTYFILFVIKVIVSKIIKLKLT